MKQLLSLGFCLALLLFAVPRSSEGATGCAYPQGLDTFPNVSTGSILTAADYNKLLCAVENLQTDFRLPNYTVATLPASPALGQQVYVTDGSTSSTCSTGGGTSKNVCTYNGTAWVVPAGSGGGANDFSELTGTASDAQIPNLNVLSTGLTGSRCVETTAGGLLTVAAGTCGTGGGTTLTNSASLSAALSDETGTGLSVFNSSPTIVTPTIASFTNAQHTHANAASGGTIPFTSITGAATDSQIPNLNILSTGLTISRCVETDASGNLTVAAGLCGVGGSTNFSTLTSGTNTAAAMVVDAGASITTSGTGTIAATTAAALTTNPTPCSQVNGNWSYDMDADGTQQCARIIQTGTAVPSSGSGRFAGDIYKDSRTFNAVTGDGRTYIASATGGDFATLAREVDGVTIFQGNTGSWSPAGYVAPGSVFNIVGESGVLSTAQTGTAGAAGTLTVAVAAGGITPAKLSNAAREFQVTFHQDGSGASNVLVATTDNFINLWPNQGGAKTITEIKAWAWPSGTASINIQRDDGSPADICTAALVATTTGVTCTVSATERLIANGHKLNLVVGTITGSPTRVTVSVLGTRD